MFYTYFIDFLLFILRIPFNDILFIYRLRKKRKLKNGFCKISENSLFWVKTISSITYEIIGTNKIKQVFINQDLSLNKQFNSSIYLS